MPQKNEAHCLQDIDMMKNNLSEAYAEEENQYRFMDRLFMLQGIYFLVTGFWPVFHIDSFMWVTGPKTDTWLVKTFGAVLGCMGLGFCISGIMRERPYSMILLATTSALALAIADVYYVTAGTISVVYLADAVAEIVLLVSWLAAMKRETYLPN
jgi:hypothetical protein